MENNKNERRNHMVGFIFGAVFGATWAIGTRMLIDQRVSAIRERLENEKQAFLREAMQSFKEALVNDNDLTIVK